MEYAPIVVFAFNRLESLQRTIESLKTNTESIESDLIVYVDGARENKAGEAEKIEEVRSYVATISGFKSLRYSFSKKNMGLGDSIIRGVSDIMNEYGRAIIMEDDLFVSSNFLSFLNQGLTYYKNVSNVFSVSAESISIDVRQSYPYDVYFAPRAGCWGWATWSDRWSSVDWNLLSWDEVRRNKKAFNKWGGSDCYGMLQDWHDGKNKSWAIRFCYAQFCQNKTSVFPLVSKVSNKGFTSEGTNCKDITYNRFKMDFDVIGRKDFRFCNMVKEMPFFVKQRLKPVTLRVRIYSKLRNLLGL